MSPRFPPEWPDVSADHVPLDAHAAQSDVLPDPKNAEILGGINDGEGLQAMAVAIYGSTVGPMPAPITAPGRSTASAVENR